jgi:ribokinase
MTVWNLGSINADHFYRVPHVPAAGETVIATGYRRGLGGKGANMSVAAARAGARVAHIGAVGDDGRWAVDRMLEYGVDTDHIACADQKPTGHAIIHGYHDGENSITVYPGANHFVSEQLVGGALSVASPGDIFLTQNETSDQLFAVQTAKVLGLRVIYAAAPFDADAVNMVLPHIDMLVLNRIEADQLAAATGNSVSALPVADVIVTMGKDGCEWVSQDGSRRFDAYKADPVDTTGAGDTFTGYLAAGLDRGMDIPTSIDLAQRAAALMVMRDGTADVIPDLKDVQDHDFRRA